MTQFVDKVGFAQFNVKWFQYPDQSLQMDFRPLINHYFLRDRFCLLHWQAKPYGLRKWGVYDGFNDQYHSCDWNNMVIKAVPRVLQIDENIFSTKPTAVLLFTGCETISNPDGLIYIQG